MLEKAEQEFPTLEPVLLKYFPGKEGNTSSIYCNLGKQEENSKGLLLYCKLLSPQAKAFEFE